MKIIEANELSPSFFSADMSGESETVREIIAAVRREGDEAVIRYTRQFDDVHLSEIRIDPRLVSQAQDRVVPITIC